jgi:DNA-binding NarL/FixJ family response regulator
MMDIRMPGMDGFAATRQIRAMDPEAHVLIVTDYDNPDYHLAAELAGARRYFVKEDLSTLLEYFREVCLARRHRSEKCSIDDA